MGRGKWVYLVSGKQNELRMMRMVFRVGVEMGIEMRYSFIRVESLYQERGKYYWKQRVGFNFGGVFKIIQKYLEFNKNKECKVFSIMFIYN